jgi:hypothetical protein
VPNGIFPVPDFDSNPSRPSAKRPSLGVRIRTRWSRNRVDDALAHGADPTSSPERSLRADQLRSPAERSRLADGLVETLADARRPEPVTLRPRPQRLQVLRYAEGLVELAARLRRTDQPVGVQGAAMTARLVDDGKSPLHREGGHPLHHAIREARVALDATVPATPDLAMAA